MITRIKTYLVISTFTLVGACSTSEPTTSYVSPKTTYEGLTPIKHTTMDKGWVRPGFDPSTYDKIMFRGAGIEYRPTKANSRGRIGTETRFPLSPENQQRLKTIVTEEFRKQLVQVQGYEVTDKPGPDTLLLVVALKDVVSHVPPDLIGRHDIYLSEVGSATLVLEFRDSDTGAVLVRGVDRRAAERYGQDFQRSSPITNWPIVKRLAATWARGLRKGIEDMRASAN